MKKSSIKKVPKTNAPNEALELRRQEELIGLLLTILGIMLLIALFSYHSNERPGLNLLLPQIENRLGIAGVYISYFFIRYTIGYPILIMPFFVIAWGINRMLGKSAQPLLKFTFLSFLMAYFVSIAFALHEIISLENAQPMFYFSGQLGAIGAQILILIFGRLGSVVVLIGLVLITIFLSTTLSVSDLFQKLSSLWARFAIQATRILREKFSVQKKSPFFEERPQRPWNTAEPTISKTPSRRIDFAPEEPKTPSKPVFRDQLDLDLEAESKSAEDEDLALQKPGQPTLAPFEKPPLELLEYVESQDDGLTENILKSNARLLEEKLADFDISARVVEIHPGPVITRYEMELAPGIKVSRITGLADDLAMAMRANRIRIVAPIPGKAAVGVEIPNPNPAIVYLREIIATPEFLDAKSPLTIALGKTISGTPYVTDLAKMPHLLVAGSTCSGKSVCLNSIIISILYKALPSEVQFVLIDPKRLELSTYAKLFRHHLNFVDGSKEKVATTPKAAIAVLRSTEQEMERRYSILANAGVRNIEEYNERVLAGHYAPPDDPNPKPLNYLIIVVDELADLMLTAAASKEVEEPIARLTQMSRAVGIHLILATQRPSVDVITGVIKANFPARIAFQVASKVDSRTILDMNGAEKLLGRGDMLFLPPASPEPIRLHNSYISLKEIETILEHVRHQPPAEKTPLPAFVEEEEGERYGYEGGGKRDPLFEEALKLVVRHQQGSVSLIQRRLKVGYSRAARLIDELEAAGIVGPFEGSKAREVLMSPEELEGLQLSDTDNEEF